MVKQEDPDVTLAYMTLAARIVESGREEEDETFLNSDWCKFLVQSVESYAEERLKRKQPCSEIHI